MKSDDWITILYGIGAVATGSVCLVVGWTIIAVIISFIGGH